jgi:L-lactate dehydrogenase complex protein LldF
MTTLPQFRAGAAATIANTQRQQAIDGATYTFASARVRALDELPDAAALRDHFKATRQATLARLGHYLEQFERNAQAAGAKVHWAATPSEASQQVLEIARQHDVSLAVKSKSMATEEIHLNHALEAAGIETVETDLGEWIMQLMEEPPYHIIAPAIHKTRQQIADLFSHHANETMSADDIDGMMRFARASLRAKFLAAGMGISGGNIGVAETGSLVLVTNEGNGRMVTSAPKVHVAVMGIEKIAANWDDAAVWLSLLARSATGQPMSIYTSVITGPAHNDDEDGPAAVHIILLDNGRSQQVGTPLEEALQCIRCGACLNVCPVYRESGGHAYGSPYSGPIGAIITPMLMGLEAYEALPQASSLCGACLDVCPTRIDIPRILLELRAAEVEEGVMPWHEQVAERAAARVLNSERTMRLAAGALRLLQKPFVKGDHLNLPAALNPAKGRKLPALAKKSFRAMWKDGEVI